MGFCGERKEGKYMERIVVIFHVWQAHFKVKLWLPCIVWRAAYFGMSKIILKTDAKELENGITTKELDRSVDESLFREIRDYMSSSFDIYRVQHSSRSCNKVAHCISK
jgi:hypothetical protein